MIKEYLSEYEIQKRKYETKKKSKLEEEIYDDEYISELLLNVGALR